MRGPADAALTCVEDGRGVSLGEDEAVRVRAARLGDLVAHRVEEEHGHHLRHGGA